MSDSNPPEARPYHHGDLRRALVDAARRLLEAEGPAAMSLRAVAREAGVSPAAPYHHFKDKGELMEAVANEGWSLMNAAMFEAARGAPDEALAPIMAYITFARSRPALYRIMYDAARQNEALPFFGLADGDSAYAWIRDVLVTRRMDEAARDVELDIAAAWCAAHGLAEMAGFRQFDSLREALGGEAEFLHAVLSHMGIQAHLR